MKNIIASIIGLFGLLVAQLSIAGTLFAINDSNNSLVTIDQGTFAVTTVGSLGVGGDFGDLTYDQSNNTLYWIAGRGNNNLYTVNQTTGAATLVGSHGINDLFSLAFDSNLGKLFAQSTNGNVYTLGLATGAATLVGANGIYPGGLAYNANTNQLLSLAAGPGTINQINPTNGAATLLSSGSTINDNGFTYDSVNNIYWADDWSNNLYRFDAAFNRTTVANLGAAYDGIAYVPTAKVPEPGSLFLIGLGLVGLVVRRSKRA
jgi:hypothetical protein